MKKNNANSANFNIKSVLFAIVPSYLFPAAMSFTSGWFLQDTQLMQASVTTIAIPSCLAAIFSLILLWQMQIHQAYPVSRIVRTLMLTFLVTLLIGAIAWNTPFQYDIANIILSATIGAAITTWRQPLLKPEEKA